MWLVKAAQGKTEGQRVQGAISELNSLPFKWISDRNWARVCDGIVGTLTRSAQFRKNIK